MMECVRSACFATRKQLMRQHSFNPSRDYLKFTSNHFLKASYFTNADRIKKDDPYASLNLSWGATVTEIKEAYKKLAREYHPDLNQKDPPEIAMKKFQRIQLAYEKLTDAKGVHRDDIADQWRFQVWRRGDIIAQQRTDVAGLARNRPIQPAKTERSNWGVLSLGHPSGSGNSHVRNEYIGDGSTKSSSVGTGRNKWVKPKEFKPWNESDTINSKNLKVV